MTESSNEYQPLPTTRKVMRHVEYSRAGDHVVIRYVDDGGNEQRVPMCLEQARVLLRWMIDDLYPDDPEPDDGERASHDQIAPDGIESFDRAVRTALTVAPLDRLRA